MPYHLRYTPYDLSSNNLTVFCDKYEKYIIAREQHSKNGEKCALHYHIYIESDLTVESIRVDFLKKLAIPKSGMGRNNKYYMLKAWNDNINYIIKQGDIVACKGYDIEVLRMLAKVIKKDEKSLEPKKEQKEYSPAGAPPPAKKEREANTMWKEIFAEGIIFEKNHKKKIEVEDALNIITKIVVKKLMPLPHPGDRKRWAQSLVMYSNMDLLLNEEPKNLEEVITENTAIFIAEHMTRKENA